MEGASVPASLLAAWGSLLGSQGGNGGGGRNRPAQAGLQESSVPGLASPPLPLQAPASPSPPRPAQGGGGRQGQWEALPGWAAAPSLCPVPLEGHSRKEAGRAGAFCPWWRPARHQHKEGRGGSSAPSLLPPSSLAVKMQHEQMANINTTMEESGAGPQHRRRMAPRLLWLRRTSVGVSGSGYLVVCVLGRDKGLLAGWFGNQSFVLSIAFLLRFGGCRGGSAF